MYETIKYSLGVLDSIIKRGMPVVLAKQVLGVILVVDFPSTSVTLIHLFPPPSVIIVGSWRREDWQLNLVWEEGLVRVVGGRRGAHNLFEAEGIV